MADITLDELVERVRLESGLRNNSYYDPAQILRGLNAGGSELYDIFTAANQKYNISEFNFTTTGQADAVVALPDDFQQGHSLEIYPDNPGQTQTIKFLPNWLNRNAFGNNVFALAPGGFFPSYALVGGNLRFYPPQCTPAAPFRLYYTPMWLPLAFPTTRTFDVNPSDLIQPNGWTFNNANFVAGEIGSIITPAFTQVSRTFNIDPADNTAGGIGWSMANAVFTSADVGGTIIPNFAAPNTAFNVAWTIASRLSATTITTTPATSTLGTFTSPPTGTATVAALSNSVFNVPYLITDVLSGQQITVTPNPQDLGTFTTPPTGTVGVATPVAGTRASLPNIMGSWSEYLVVYAAMAINIDRQRPIGELERKLNALKARIASILGNRQEEPQQPPLSRGGFDWGGGWGGGWDG